MSLPILAIPQYEIQLYSQSKPLTFRPYLVKEEKLMLMAQQSENPQEIERAVKQIIHACTFGKIDVDQLPSFDVELLFLKLRAKSVNNVVDVKFECQAKSADSDSICGAINTISVDVDTIQLTVPEGHARLVEITPEITLEFQYPTAKVFDELAATNGKLVDAVERCLLAVHQKDGTSWSMQDYTPEERQAFIDSLTIGQLATIQSTFFDTLPSLQHTVHFVCEKCGHTEDILLTGLMDFFG